MFELWLKEFEKELESLPLSERKKAVEYYKELFADKSDAGILESDILESFGSARSAALSLLENYGEKRTDGESASEKAFAGDEGVDGESVGNPYGSSKWKAKKKTDADGEEKTIQNVLAIVVTVLVAVFFGSAVVSLLCALLTVETTLLSVGLGLVVFKPTVGAGLIALGVLFLLLFPFIILGIFLVNLVIKLCKKVYTLIKEGK